MSAEDLILLYLALGASLAAYEAFHLVNATMTPGTPRSQALNMDIKEMMTIEGMSRERAAFWAGLANSLVIIANIFPTILRWPIDVAPVLGHYWEERDEPK